MYYSKLNPLSDPIPDAPMTCTHSLSRERKSPSYICNTIYGHIMLVFVMEMFYKMASEEVKRNFNMKCFRKVQIKDAQIKVHVYLCTSHLFKKYTVEKTQ